MLGYGIGFIGQGSTYNFITAYFIVFMTNCVGMSSTLAGTITSLALLCEVITGMVVGNLSDNCESKLGRRRPFVLTASIFMPIVMVLITRTVDFSSGLTFTYYLVLSIMFRILFSTFEIPNNAFGAEIAKGYDERTRLRTLSRVFSITGNALGYVMPLFILEMFNDNPQDGWKTIGMILAIVCFTSWLGAFLLTKKYGGVHRAKKKGNVARDIFVNYFQLCRLKTMRILMVYKAAFACAFALFNIGTIYYLKYCLGLGNKYSSYMYVFTIIIFIIMTPIANYTAIKFGKANQQMITMGIGMVTGFSVYFIGPDSILGGILYVGAFSMMQTSFWQLSSSIFYDVVEVDEYVNGKRREGDIMSLVSVLGTLITAIIVQVFGILLETSGFNPALATEPESVIGFLNGAYILAPSMCFLIGFIALKVFPINKKTFTSLQNALELKKKGKDYDTYLEDIMMIL